MSTPFRAAIAFVRAVLATTFLTAGLFGLAQGVVAATPAPLADGSEVVVTDREGDHLLGYGRVEGGVLRLSLAAHDDDGLAVMVIDPGGGLSTLVGRFASDGLRVHDPDGGEDVTLLSWLSERGVSLTLDSAGRSSDDDRENDRDDDRDDDAGGDDASDDDASDDDGQDDAPADDPSDDEDDEDDQDDAGGDDGQDDAPADDPSDDGDVGDDGGDGDDGRDDGADDDAGRDDGEVDDADDDGDVEDSDAEDDATDDADDATDDDDGV